MHLPSILVIDDEPNNFDVIEALLSDQDYELYYAASGEEGIANLETYNPDLILLDVMMPGIDGIEVCRQIKAMSAWQAVPIIMVTALSAKSDLANCLNAGADDFISKPVNTIELRARVSSMLRIKHQYDNLQTMLKLREDMVKMVVHDLRNPLTIILFGLELLKNPNYPQDQQNIKLNQVYSSAQTLQVLIDDLLNMALLESGQIRLNRTQVKLCSLIESAISNFEAVAEQKNQSLVSQLPEAICKKVTIDVTLYHRVLDNLISNAIKFSPHKSKIIVSLELLNSGDCRIQVIDSGPGVPEQLQQKIFEKYEVGTMMSGVSQIGLGLAFCKMVVEAHGDKICVISNQPQGAIFEIILKSNEKTVGNEEENEIYPVSFSSVENT
ncbi:MULTISPECIES: hybrid sensor histidine kinase/response regulator [Okeania]|uniref:hybrid sensor histidine kinase/response regulator n=1 Tax=Okeania TaxID=1458928 RepID=UPI000F544FDF|nr:MULTISPECIES: hybrid sensor histidine kinase/response regulator [Okeania]NEP39088.1 hybrid sensor histidine kinase/response regulator [Okeania sp. SIO2H7]NEP74113.1 hybrid sensor histidine kinase/response regulator [Okeania sp. SIO2G5]NEP95051.1 hybrid sensor histidine kinase/response regulator [Okeania sp. SIO2F5]NEQ92828.1 hybrid sensor histidine kinase/response regulator [Okeania sp. SIO2G4]NES78427.1 hybrid sensor histidine kinase/response regulator [Okeania sp. SIO1H4]